MSDEEQPEEGTRPEIVAPPALKSVGNRAERRKAERIKPLEKGTKEGAPKQDGGLMNLFKPKPEAYVPVLKSLEIIGLEPKMMEVLIGEEPVSCFVIPTQDLVYKEWQHMTQAKYALGPVNGEVEDSE